MIESFTIVFEYFSMFKIKCRWNMREYGIKNTGVKVAIICSNGGKETIIYVYIINNTN